MASACINKFVFSPENFPFRSWKHPFLTPQSSLVGEMPNQNASVANTMASPANLSDPPQQPDPDLSGITTDFEFRLEQPVTMLPADQLFSDGKLFPLHFPVIRQDTTSISTSAPATDFSGHKSPDTTEARRGTTGVSTVDSLSAPRSSRWKQLLRLKKLCQNNSKTTSSPSSGATKSIKHFLHRSSKQCDDSSVNLPLLNDTDNEPATSAPSLTSSSSSGVHDPDDIHPPPRVSIDSEKPLKVKLVKTRTLSSDGSLRCVDRATIESPRMNSSGKIVFHGLERSSSSPSSFYGGPGFKHRGVERTYSGNVRVAPVLNVPVCSLIGSSKSGGVFGFPLFSSSQKQEGSTSTSSGSNRGASRNQQTNGKTKTDPS